MEFTYKDKEFKEINIEKALRIEVEDSRGKRYRIREDMEGGIEILAEDGKLIVEPHMANVIIIKTTD